MSQVKVYLNSEEKYQKRLIVVRAAMTQGTQAAAVRFGVSERTVRSWKARFRVSGAEGLRDQSRAPKTIRGLKDREGILTKALVELNRAEPGLNRVQVLSKLMFEPSKDLPTISWIARTRKRLGLTKRSQRKKESHKKRYEIPVPGALQIDTKYVENAQTKGDFLYQFTAIDECSRVRYLSGSLTKGAEAARKFLIEAVRFFEGIGVHVWRVQTDHGTEFTLPETERVATSFAKGQTPEHVFTKECESRGIRHRLIRVATPELNGKVERSHRIDNERFYSRFEFRNEHELDNALKTIWMPEYNELRPHGGLKYRTPKDFLNEKLKDLNVSKTKELQAQYEEKKAA